MKNIIITLTSILTLLCSQVFAQSAEEKGLDIIEKSIALDNGFVDSTVVGKMILKDKSGNESIRSFKNFIFEELDKTLGDKSIIVFTEPRDVKGTSLLTHANIEPKDDDQWLYLPALKRVKRITSDNRSGSFVGSEFAYEDLGSQELEKYSERIFLRDEKCPNQIELMCHVISRKPTEKSSGYSSQTLWLDNTIAHRIWKIDYYDRKGSLLKTLMFDKYKIYLDKFWRPEVYEMTNHQTGKYTKLLVKDIKFNEGLLDKDFNQKSLSRIR